MKVKAYSALSDIDNDLKRLSKEFSRTSKVYHHSKSALACAKLEVTAGLKKEVQDQQFWKCFDYSKYLHGFDTVLANIELCLYHQFGDSDAFPTTLRHLSSLRQRVAAETGGLKTTISVLASQQVPRPFRKAVLDVKKRLGKLPCTAATAEYQFFPATKGMYFVCYLSFANLRDKNGYINPNFHVAVAKYYGTGTAHMKLSVSRGKKIPSEMAEVTANTLWDRVVSGLTAKNVEVKA